MKTLGFSGVSVVKNLPAVQIQIEPRFDPWVRKISWRRKWQPTLVFLPGKSHGQRRLVGYSSCDHKRFRHGLVTKQQQMKTLFLTRRD